MSSFHCGCLIFCSAKWNSDYFSGFWAGYTWLWVEGDCAANIQASKQQSSRTRQQIGINKQKNKYDKYVNLHDGRVSFPPLFSSIFLDLDSSRLIGSTVPLFWCRQLYKSSAVNAKYLGLIASFCGFAFTELNCGLKDGAFSIEEACILRQHLTVMITWMFFNGL